MLFICFCFFILDFAVKRCAKKGWPEPNVTSLKQQMGNSLCDDRCKLRFKAETEMLQQQEAEKKKDEEGNLSDNCIDFL